jgi:hypothetical protein
LLFLLAGAFFVVFHYWGGVRREPSLLLGIAFSIIALCLFVLLQFAAFRPYRLIVGINYEALWEDLKLAPTNGPKFQNFAFTAISRQIYARSDDRNYSTQINLSVEVPVVSRLGR